MKSSMPYRGVAVPVVRSVCRSVYASFPLDTFEAWQGTVLMLWDQAEFREERYAAVELVGYSVYKPYRTLDVVPLYERLITTGAWWDLVDGLATHEVGDLLRRYPDPIREQLLGWSRCSDRWLRRTAILAQVSFKGATDQALLYACIEPNVHERDFFLRKAIGWALREYAKAAPEAVRQYVAAHTAELSPLSRREALKHLQVSVAGLQSEEKSV